jgi:alkylation response protein AidB-like acyl-CoA dehydrogenase
MEIPTGTKDGIHTSTMTLIDVGGTSLSLFPILFSWTYSCYRAAMREFVEKEIMPFTFEWDEAKAVPKELFEKCYKAGWLAAVVGPPWQTKYHCSFLVLNSAMNSDSPQDT